MMKSRSSKKFIVFILSTMILFAVGCKDKNPVALPGDGSLGSGTHDDKIILDTEIVLLKDNVSVYKIVIPQNAHTDEQTAARELQYFFSLATDVELPIIYDSEVSYSEDATYLYLGRTNQLIGAGIMADKNELHDSGYIVQRKGNGVFMTGGGTIGTVYSSYSFLRHTVGYEAFAFDEYSYNKVSDLKLPDFNIKDIPDFAARAPGYFNIIYNSEYANRMRVESYLRDWGLWSHTHFLILPKTQYYSTHPNWYMTGRGANLEGAQLCMTRDVGDLDAENTSTTNMRYHFVENLKRIIEEKPDSKYFMLGQQDGDSFCNCDSCQKSNAKYGGKSGTNMRFTNAVVRDITKWLKTAHPERADEILFCTFGYAETAEPPTVYANGVFSPKDSSVVAEKNLGVMLAPIAACYEHPIKNETCNSSTKSMIEGWQTITDKIFIWNYCTHFTEYFLNMDNFKTMQQNYKIFLDSKTIYFFDQGPADHYTSAFSELRVYVQSNLMWNTDLSVQDLIEKFIKQYYKDAAQYVQKYYDLIYTRYAVMEKQWAERGKEMHSYVFTCWGFMDKEFWPQPLMLQCLNLFDKAIEEVNTKVTDADIKEILIRRLKTERLSPLYLLLELNRSGFNADIRNSYIDTFEADCNELNIKFYAEGTFYVSDKVALWREF